MLSATTISRQSRSRITGREASAAVRVVISFAVNHIAPGQWRNVLIVSMTRIATAAALMLLIACPSIAGPVQTYLALGDSIAFGETDVIPVSFGDQGYVKPFADFLATQNGGTRPDVINLAFPGETSSSFFTAVPPPGFAPHTALDGFNLNYQANPA